MKKICTKCKEEKDVSQFYVSTEKHKDGSLAYFSSCKECYGKKYYSGVAKKRKENHNRMKKQCIDYKGGKCSICGYNKCMASLDFHHINENLKEYEISKMVSSLFEFDRIKVELDKCLLLCSNCHRELHFLGGIKET